jgi:site-specific DNA recombinase
LGLLIGIAQREYLAERHVRFLAPLAHLSPRIVEAIAEGLAPTGLTVCSLARALPFSWPEQEASVRID